MPPRKSRGSFVFFLAEKLAHTAFFSSDSTLFSSGRSIRVIILAGLSSSSPNAAPLPILLLHRRILYNLAMRGSASIANSALLMMFNLLPELLEKHSRKLQKITDSTNFAAIW
jgi:hypothetical protein